jgi:hypothetical protein
VRAVTSNRDFPGASSHRNFELQHLNGRLITPLQEKSP